MANTGTILSVVSVVMCMPDNCDVGCVSDLSQCQCVGCGLVGVTGGSGSL